MMLRTVFVFLTVFAIQGGLFSSHYQNSLIALQVMEGLDDDGKVIQDAEAKVVERRLFIGDEEQEIGADVGYSAKVGDAIFMEARCTGKVFQIAPMMAYFFEFEWKLRGVRQDMTQLNYSVDESKELVPGQEFSRKRWIQMTMLAEKKFIEVHGSVKAKLMGVVVDEWTFSIEIDED